MFFRLLALLLLGFFLAGCASLAPLAAPTLSPLESRGRGVFDHYCSRCHGTQSDIVVVGPSLAGVATRAGTRIAGMDAQAYIRDSILNPTAYTVDGFVEGTMPLNFRDEIPPDDFEAVVAFLLTLK